METLGITSPGHGEGTTLPRSISVSVSRWSRITRSCGGCGSASSERTYLPWYRRRVGLREHLLDVSPSSRRWFTRSRFSAGAAAGQHAGQQFFGDAVVAGHAGPGATAKEAIRRGCDLRPAPVLASDDVLAFAPYLDAMLLVVEEGKTQREQLAARRAAPGHEPDLIARC